MRRGLRLTCRLPLDGDFHKHLAFTRVKLGVNLDAERGMF